MDKTGPDKITPLYNCDVTCTDYTGRSDRLTELVYF